MAKYKIEFERDRCIGARSCTDACPDNWTIKEDGKSACKYTEFDDDKLECNMEAAKACPVNAIHIINNESGERLV